MRSLRTITMMMMLYSPPFWMPSCGVGAAPPLRRSGASFFLRRARILLRAMVQVASSAIAVPQAVAGEDEAVILLGPGDDFDFRAWDYFWLKIPVRTCEELSLGSPHVRDKHGFHSSLSYVLLVDQDY